MPPPPPSAGRCWETRADRCRIHWGTLLAGDVDVERLELVDVKAHHADIGDVDADDEHLVHQEGIL